MTEEFDGTLKFSPVSWRLDEMELATRGMAVDMTFVWNFAGVVGLVVDNNAATVRGRAEPDYHWVTRPGLWPEARFSLDLGLW